MRVQTLEKKKQRLSSQNPKLKRTKESENSGGQKADRKRCKSRGRKGPEKPERKLEGKGEPEEAAAEIEPGRRRKEIADEACMKLNGLALKSENHSFVLVVR